MKIFLVTLLFFNNSLALPTKESVFEILPGIDLLTGPEEGLEDRSGDESLRNKTPVETIRSRNNFSNGTHPKPITDFSDLYDDDCHIKYSTVYYNGECSRLLSTLSCDPGNWLVLNEAGIPKCVRKPCPQKQIWYEGMCVDIADDSVCGEAEILYLEFTGDAFCDCENNFVYDLKQEKCIPHHTQWTCSPDKLVEISPQGNTTCVSNPCPANMIPNLKNNKCYTKNFEGSCDFNSIWELYFNDTSESVTCVIKLSTKNIFEVAALTSCPAGSKRDALGKCSRLLRLRNGKNPFSFKVPTIHKSRYSICPLGYTTYPDGSCGKLNSIFN